MLEDIFNAPFFSLLKDEIKKSPSLILEELWDCPKSLIISYLRKELGCDILVISGGNRESRLIDDLTALGQTSYEFPAWEALPGDDITPSSDVIGERLSQLNALSNQKNSCLVVTPLQGVLQKLPSKDALYIHTLTLKVGDEISFDSLAKKLTELGYTRETLVEDKGQFAIRGGLLDIFPTSEYNPFRLDFFGDTIEEIKTFDPMSQSSNGHAESIQVVPANELELTMQESSTLLDYLKPNTLIILDDLLKIEDKYVELKSLPGAISPYMLDFHSFLKDVKDYPTLYFAKEKLNELYPENQSTKPGRDYYTGKTPSHPVKFSIFDYDISTNLFFQPFIPLTSFFDIDAASLEDHQLQLQQKLPELPSNFNLHMFSATRAEEKTFKAHMARTILPENTSWSLSYFSSGFIYPAANIGLFPYAEYSKRQKVTRKKWRNTYHTAPSEFHQLEVGDYVVHFHNGIGKFMGIEKQKNHLGITAEFMLIEYKGNAKLFVPMSQAHLVSRYIGAGEIKPDLHQIGTKKWHQAKVKAQKAIIGYAKELLQIQATRQHKGGYACPADSDEMKLFEEEFPYEETEDQLLAIHDIRKDMIEVAAMDRLVCGDVGYGKTEVAMRAAFKMAFDGKKQVAVLAPTTILAMQHYESFKARMENFGVNIGLVCRFKTPKQNKQTLEQLARGEIDILLGTHRILSKDVIFKDLGLIVIDEEQRFGVRAKEKLKTIKAGVDCITMTATPIPRTLYFSLLNIRPLSVIASPPHDRLPIRTVICDREEGLIKNAIQRELARDGQVYFIHNRVETIYQVASEIEKLIPSAKIAIVHGQMDSNSIDEVFHAFKSGEVDVLFATSIVENGIDIPNANTILIDRAHHFGISDLYQLRGRVGRWNRTAYAYFLTPKFQALPELSQKRLQALIESSGHGGGMKLAMMDLEIRGAGDILGTQQSGQVSTVGFHLYCKLLKKTITALQEGKSTTFIDTKMEFKFDAFIPEHYVDDTSLRLEFYHRFGDAVTLEEADKVMNEIQDRFGKAPTEVEWLYHLTRIKVYCMNNLFTLLKFDRLTVTAERQLKKSTEKKTFFMPQAISGRELELITLKRLSEEFQI
ncbi:MAG: transcription-repair coupling factor [Rhabdochlamydiaceae bacterium]|nr:transcription-repair coupling factor [Candidatus Amphrikana amoebophyrae]